MRPSHPSLGQLVAVLMVFVARQAAAQLFTEVPPAGLIEPASPCVAWGDYDGDGDYDLLVAGEVEVPASAPAPSTILYENTNGSFSDSTISLPDLKLASASWADYDNDGDLDLAMIGQDSADTAVTRVYRNDGGSSFVALGSPLTNVFAGDLAWGDYDNDGDLDLIVTGITAPAPGGTPETRLYRNDGGTFISVLHPFPHVHLSAVAWGDYDDDGDLDLVITGASTSGIVGGLFNNDGGSFTDAGAGLTAVQAGFAAWGDYDNDGDLDLLLGGSSNSLSITKLYQNNDGVLEDSSGAVFPGLSLSSAGWSDYDNDGDLDIAINGFENLAAEPGPLSRLFRNDDGTFVDSTESFPDAFAGAVAWADYDNDGDLDLLMGGREDPPVDLLRLYKNGTTTANTAPTAPGNLAATADGSTVSFSWDAASDAETTAAGLSYAIRVGTTPGGTEIVSPGADTSSGDRLLPSPGNIRQGRMATLVGLAPGTYYWSVQAIDSAFGGSSFAAEQSFTVLAALPQIVSTTTEGNQIRIIWSGSPGGTYSVEASQDLSAGSWTEIATPVADGSGLFEVLETLSLTRRFYRAARP